MVLVAFHQKNSLITGVENDGLSFSSLVIFVPGSSLPLTKIVLPQKNLDQHLNDHAFFFCILFIYFLFTGIVQTTYRSKHTNITKFTTTTLITKKKKKKIE